MLAVQRSFCRLPRIAQVAAMLAFPAVAVFGQTAAGPSTPAPAASCPAMVATEIPLGATLAVKSIGMLDSGHLKPGKEIWFKVANGLSFPGCNLETDAPVYAKVLSSTTTKTSGKAELSLIFDHADCNGHAKQAIEMRVVAVLAPADELRRMHDDQPTKIAGGARKITDNIEASNGLDAKLNPGGTPHTVRPGTTLGLPKIKLEPQGGPECSAKLTSTDKSVQLEQDATFLLVIHISK
jgi:hypothetical protein